MVQQNDIEKRTGLKRDWLNVAGKLLTERGFIDPQFRLTKFEYEFGRGLFVGYLDYMAGAYGSATIAIMIDPADFDGKPIEEVADMVSVKVLAANAELLEFINMGAREPNPTPRRKNPSREHRTAGVEGKRRRIIPR